MKASHKLALMFSLNLSLTFGLLLNPFAPVFAQRPAPTPAPPGQPTVVDDEVVRITTNLVQVDAVVTDRQGNHVTDLRADDFEVLENGRPQQITNFSYVATAPAATTNVAARASTDPSAPPAPPARLPADRARRTIALVVDDRCLSVESIYYVRRALRKYADEQLEPGDLVTLIRISLRPLHYTEAGTEPGEMRVAVWLLGVSAIVLLIACANVANLMLARGLRRRREIGVRVALGIHPRRLLRLVLTESILLAVIGGVFALLVAHWGAHAMRAFLLPDVDWTEPPLSGRVLLFSGVVALTLGIALGMLPALQALRQKLTATLSSGAREGGGRRSRMHMGLTVAQAALSVVLLVGAGLFVRSLANVRGLDLGIEPDRVVVLGLSLPGTSGMTEAERAVESVRRRQMYGAMLEHVRGMTGIEDAAVAVGTPFRSWFTVRLRVPGRDSIPRLPGGGPYISAVTSGYFRTVGTRILRGRSFTQADRAGSEPVVIVNETMATTLWPDDEPLGKCLFIGRDAEDCARVVGVAEPARRSGIREEPSMQYYIPFGQERGIGGNSLLVRPRPGAASVVENLRREIHALEPSVRYVSATTLQELLDPQLRPWKLGAAMFALFGGLALLIAAVGLYSVIAYAVAQRRSELGIRMALGARPIDITRMVVAEGTGLVAVGVVIGVAIALVAGRWVEALLFDVTARDPSTFIAVAATLFAVALAATLVPARRAGRVDPTEALRAD